MNAHRNALAEGGHIDRQPPSDSAAAGLVGVKEPSTAAFYREKADVMGILNTNKNKSFVDRILNPRKYPSLDRGGGEKATHRMAWGEADGKYMAFPTVLWDGKQLVDYGNGAWPIAQKSGNYIEFDTPEEADWFSQRYKLAWGVDPGFKPNLQSTSSWHANRFSK
jgi:hypothetical protein